MSRTAKLVDVREREVMIFRTLFILFFVATIALAIALTAKSGEDRIFILSQQGDIMTISSAGIEIAAKRTAELFADKMANVSPQTVEGNVKSVLEICAPGYKAAFIARLEREDFIRKIKTAGRQQTFIQTTQSVVVSQGSGRYEVTIPGQLIVSELGERHYTRNMLVIVKVLLDTELRPHVDGFSFDAQ